MKDGAATIRTAINLLTTPSRVRLHRTEDLPTDVDVLLRIAARDHATLDSAAALVDRPSEMVQRAAAFYIEQILLDPQSDSYRVLGSRLDASASDLRRNMALLLRWLHPDIEANAEQSVYTRRVTAAWENLKTPDRRAAYDRSLDASNLDRKRRRRAPVQNATAVQNPRFGFWRRTYSLLTRSRT